MQAFIIPCSKNWPPTVSAMDEKRYFQGTDGAELMYRQWTPEKRVQNTPIVLLHGAASNATRWWYFVKYSRLVTDRVLLRPDLRGNGESIWRGPARMEHWSQDIADMLRHAHVPAAIVVGHCLGANIALNFASRYPEMCAGLVLIEPMVRQAVTGILARFRLFLPLLRLIVVLIKILNWFGIYRRQLDTIDLEKLDRQVHKASRSELDEVLALYGLPHRDIKVTPTVQYLGNFIEAMRPLPVSGVNCPSLVIQSSGHSITDPDRTQLILRTLPEVEFIELESEHWIPATQPDSLCKLIDAWVLWNQTNTQRTDGNTHVR